MEKQNEKYLRRFSEMKKEADDWRAHWKEISEYIMPRKGRYLAGEKETKNEGGKKHQKIINGVAKEATRTLAAGMQGGLVSPSRPWFALGLKEEELMEIKPVKTWLHDTRNVILTALAKSNFYGAAYNLFEEAGGFGIGAMIMEEDTETSLRCRPLTIGEYYISLDSKYRANALYRKFSMSARQMVEKFGEDKVSFKVKENMEKSSGEGRFEVIHAIEENEKYNPEKDDIAGKRFISVYFEEASDDGELLSTSGYRTIPFMTPRWRTTGVDTYGSCPSMDALGDVKMLQKLEEKKLKAIGKMIDPPMNAPSKMKSQGGTVVEGGINYVDLGEGGQSFSPVFQVQMDIRSVSEEIYAVEKRIKRFFYNDLFLSIINENKQMTATEIIERQSEKLVMLGPVLEKIQSEFLTKAVERSYDILDDNGLIPEPPEELAGREIKIEFISSLMVAQKAVATESIERTLDFVTRSAQLNPNVLDKFDSDEAVDQFATMTGIPPKVVRSDDEVAELRAQRQQQQQAQMALEQASQIAQTSKTMSETPVGDSNALEVVNEGAQQ